MAYFIDKTGKRGLKAEGKQFFAWDFDARKFVLPVDDAPPKSRMERCSEFQAKLFNFCANNPEWEADFDRLHKDYMSHPKHWEAGGDPTVDDARRDVLENARFCEALEGRVAALLKPLVAYGVDGAWFADKIRNLQQLLVVSRKMAGIRLELAENIQEAFQTKAQLRECEKCEFARTGQGRKLCEECADGANGERKE